MLQIQVVEVELAWVKNLLWWPPHGDGTLEVPFIVGRCDSGWGQVLSQVRGHTRVQGS